MTNPNSRTPWTLYVGDARTVLAAMPDQAANCIVTSPPYWGKRDYRVMDSTGKNPPRRRT